MFILDWGWTCCVVCVVRLVSDDKGAPELPRGYSSSSYQQSPACRWQAPTTMQRGDVLIFNVKTIHAATVQSHDRNVRFSLDTRVTTCSPQQRLEPTRGTGARMRDQQ
jgi:ectoine hydroxylase-related dioxygenase (phytanoyl-CoA dioxygenase family)